jgi:signal transduction histidine kinase
VNAAFPSLVGTSANAVHDIHGVGIGIAAWKAVAKNGSGSVEYAWTNPVTKNTEPKISFVQKVDADVLCGVGAYKQPR